MENKFYDSTRNIILVGALAGTAFFLGSCGLGKILAEPNIQKKYANLPMTNVVVGAYPSARYLTSQFVDTEEFPAEVRDPQFERDNNSRLLAKGLKLIASSEYKVRYDPAYLNAKAEKAKQKKRVN